MTPALDELVDLLDLEPLEVNLYRGFSPDEQRLRVFGGQVAAQALIAAGRTVGDGRAGGLCRPGGPDPDAPSGKRLRRVRVQHGTGPRSSGVEQSATVQSTGGAMTASAGPGPVTCNGYAALWKSRVRSQSPV